MKKFFLAFLFALLSASVMAQLINANDSLSSDIKAIKENLAKYCGQRQTGIVLALGGGSVALVSHLAIVNSAQAKKVAVIAGCLAGIAGVCITIDADKWIRRASLGISPGKLTLNF